VYAAEREYTKELLDAALSESEPDWPSAVDVLAARQNLEAHDTTVKSLSTARSWAEARIGRAIVACERQLIGALDDKLGQLQHEAHLRKAAHAVPLGVGGDDLLAAGPDTAAQAAHLGDALGRYEQIKTARRVIFDYVHPQTAPWLAVVAEGMENGAIWTSEIVHLASGTEPPPWANGVGGELHYAILKGIRLRCMTAAQLDQAGYDPPVRYLQAIGMR
jgi:hypothetical protein